jgi:hypothetical protein
MSTTGTFISFPTNQQGSNPKLVTESVRLPVSGYLVEVAKDNIEGHKILHKFGSGTVGTTPVPITSSGFWRTPLSPVYLEFVSDNINDTNGGTGATKVVVQGLDENWNEITQEIVTNGTTAVPIPISLVRLYRWYVSESGSYADETNGSYAGELTIQVLGGGDVWDIIEGVNPFPGQSEIGVAVIPDGYSGYILSKNIFTDTTKVASIYFMQRPFASDVTSPYAGIRRLIERDTGVTGGYNIDYLAPKGPYFGPCDIGFMANVSVGTADISVEFEMLLIKDGY